MFGIYHRMRFRCALQGVCACNSASEHSDLHIKIRKIVFLFGFLLTNLYLCTRFVTYHEQGLRPRNKKEQKIKQ